MPFHVPNGNPTCGLAVKDNRPVNLDIGTISLPITAIVSITHRGTGVFIFAGVAMLLWMLDTSLSSPEGLEQVKACLAQPMAKLALFAILVGLIFHSCAGVKHLIMDLGYGETMEGGILGARLVFAATIVLSILAGLWIW